MLRSRVGRSLVHRPYPFWSDSTKSPSADHWFCPDFESGVTPLFLFYHYYFGFFSSELASAVLLMTSSRSSRIQTASHPHRVFILHCSFLLFPGLQISATLSSFRFINNVQCFFFLKPGSASWIVSECPHTHPVYSKEFVPFYSKSLWNKKNTRESAD